MFRRTLVFSGVLVATALLAQNRPTLRVDVPLVMVDVQVSDADGRPVTNLTRDDFQIFEDGKLHSIAVFEPVDSPYSIQLILDRSTRMEIYWPLFEPALAGFLASLKPRDRVSIGAFDERTKVVDLLLDWREAQNGKGLNKRINPAILGVNAPPTSRFSGFVGSSDTYGAIEWAAQRLQVVNGRKGAIFFGDGSPGTHSERRIEFDGIRYVQLIDGKDDKDFKTLERRIRDSKAHFDVIAVGTDLNPVTRPREPAGTFLLTG